MARRAPQNDIRVINPMFPIPDGLRDFRYTEPKRLTGDTDEIDFIATSIELIDESVTDEEYDQDIPDVPTSLVVISQSIRNLPDGSQVVDLVVDVEDVGNVSKYDFRIVKT